MLRSTHLRFDASSHPSAEARKEAFRAAMSLSMDVHYKPDDVESFCGSGDPFSLGPAVRTMRDALRTVHRIKPNAARAAASSLTDVDAQLGATIAAFLDGAGP